MSGPRGSAERASAQMYADRMRTEIISLRAEVGRLKEQDVKHCANVKRLLSLNATFVDREDAYVECGHARGRLGRELEDVWKLADELVAALGDMCVHANEPCRCEERGQECVCGWAATRRSAEALIAKHTEMKETR